MSRRASQGHVLEDGRLKLDLSGLKGHFLANKADIERPIKRKYSRLTLGSHTQQCARLQPIVGIPRMNIAILITGSRGDVQPFIALGKKLQTHGHRVRIGTHGNFRELVLENGLEFYSIGGDPEQLMAYMVKNPGVLPSLESVKAGDVGARKADLEAMLLGAWHACTEACDEHDKRKGDGEESRPFVADAIISNPPTYASLHIAERLAIPLHYMFTMPWSPTTAFPHPLAQMDSSRTEAGVRNYLSYTQIELLTWLGLTDIINRFRRRTLLLEPIDPTWGTNLVSRLKVPHTYCWSPALIPKPADWGSHIGISGFFFLSKASSYQPDATLQAFLDAGEPPVYIGFGSIVVDNPDAFTKLILEAVKKAGVRALVSKGWSNVGGSDVPDNVFLLGNVPHDWLFQHVSAVVHHGGAGTCAIGLALGLPTVIVPFFGDQFWWAGIVHRAGAGPKAVPYKELTADKLSESIKEALQPDIRDRAQELSQKIKSEDGVATAVDQFHKLQSVQTLACYVCPDRAAIWRVRRTNIKLSAVAVAILSKHKRLQSRDVKLIRHRRWYVDEGAPGPISGAVASVADTGANCVSDVQDFKRSIARKRLWKEKLQNEKESHGIEDHCPSTGKAVAKLCQELAVEGATAPINFFYQVANGFHNAPATFFHDRTVRIRTPAFTGFGSGLQVAGKEVIFGLYDGVTGLATQPINGYKDGQTRKGGVAWGTLKGVGRGLGGVVFKVGAVAFGVPGYTLKGAEMQFRRQGIEVDQLADLRPPSVPDQPGRPGDDERKKKLQKQWAQASAGHPILQRRVLQALAELHDVEENEPDLEAAVLARWDLLVGANDLRHKLSQMR